MKQKEFAMAETHEIPEYIPGDHVELHIHLRHKHNVVAVEAGFAHETSSNVTFNRRSAPQLERREGDDKVSEVRFAPMRVSPESPLGEYRCTYVYAYYPTNEGSSQRGANLSVPQGLRFRIIEEPTDPPEVVDWGWSDSDATTSAEKHTDNGVSVSDEAVESQSGVEATPDAKRKAEELEIDLSEVEGTGSGGRILVKDVESAAKQQKE